MSLRSRIQDLRTYAEVANDEHRVRLRTGQLSRLSERLAVPTQQLPTLTVGLAEVRQLEVEIPAGLNQGAVQVADEFRSLAAELPAMAIDANLERATFEVRNAEKLTADLRGHVADCW